jgi:hypothetical protein
MIGSYSPPEGAIRSMKAIGFAVPKIERFHSSCRSLPDSNPFFHSQSLKVEKRLKILKVR